MYEEKEEAFWGIADCTGVSKEEGAEVDEQTWGGFGT